MTRFTPTLGHDPAYMKDPDERSQPYEFHLTRDERSQASVATCHLEAFRRRQNERDEARALADLDDKLVVRQLSVDDLSPEERRSFGL